MDTTGTGKLSSKKNCFNISQKIAVLKWVRDNKKSSAEASRHFDIHERNIQKWKKIGLYYFEQVVENRCIDADNTYHPISLTKCRIRKFNPKFPELENQLLKEIEMRRKMGLDKSKREWLPNMAKELFHNIYKVAHEDISTYQNNISRSLNNSHEIITNHNNTEIIINNDDSATINAITVNKNIVQCRNLDVAYNCNNIVDLNLKNNNNKKRTLLQFFNKQDNNSEKKEYKESESQQSIMEAQLYPPAKKIKLNEGSTFVASKKWVNLFMNRHNLVGRKVTCKKQMNQVEFEELLIQWSTAEKEFIQSLPISNFRENSNEIVHWRQYNCDEIPIVLGSNLTQIASPEDNTIQVRKLITSFDVTKRVCSVFLTTRKDGYSQGQNNYGIMKPIKPFVIFKGKNGGLTKERPKYDRRVEIEFDSHSLNSTYCMKQYVKRCIPNLNHKGLHLLYMDNYYSHFDEKSVDDAKKKGFIIRYLPANASHFCQPVDQNVGVFVQNHVKHSYRIFRDTYNTTNKCQIGIRKLRILISSWIADAFADLLTHEVLLKKSWTNLGI